MESSNEVNTENNPAINSNPSDLPDTGNAIRSTPVSEQLTDKGVPEGTVSPDEITDVTSEEQKAIQVYEVPVETLKRVAQLLAAALSNLIVARRIGIDSLGEIIASEIEQAGDLLGINFITQPAGETPAEIVDDSQ